MNARNLIFALLLATPLSTPAATPAMVSNGMLTDSGGMTLYTFDKDVAGNGKSVCNDACAKNWPPFLAKKGETANGEYSLVTRDDGATQWAFKGKPLYLWNKDKKPGDMMGDGLNNVWHVVKP
jgi:predicted lipoprotein with Yx(FWY)xxD motif